MRALAIGNFSDFLIGSFAGFYCHFGHFEYLNFRILMFRAGWTAKVSFFSQLMVVSIVNSRIYNDVTYVVNCR